MSTWYTLPWSHPSQTSKRKYFEAYCILVIRTRTGWCGLRYTKLIVKWDTRACSSLWGHTTRQSRGEMHGLAFVCTSVQTPAERINHHLSSFFRTASTLCCRLHRVTTWALTAALRKLRSRQRQLCNLESQTKPKNRQKRPNSILGV